MALYLLFHPSIMHSFIANASPPLYTSTLSASFFYKALEYPFPALPPPTVPLFLRVLLLQSSLTASLSPIPFLMALGKPVDLVSPACTQ